MFKMGGFYCLLFGLLYFHINVCFSNYCDADFADCREGGNRMYGKLLVAAIDFGTTYSGWAFSFKHEYARDPTDISFSQWHSGEYQSLKAPTTVLIKPDGKTLDSFGYDAETRYIELAATDEQHDYFYFKRFKMMLHGIKHLSRHTTIEDEKGHDLSALTVFALAIEFLKTNLMETLRNREPRLEETDISWVLTVPAIWNDGAKQFMREAAVQAGIDNNDLKIALEPEAASLYCRLVPAEKILDDDGHGRIISFTPGTKYMVLDAGGGTVDISVHEVMNNGKLKELSKASGGPWGGTKVDRSFLKFLKSILGGDVLNEFKRTCEYDYLHLLRDFEIKKRSIYPNKNNKIIFRIPECLRNLTLRLTGKTMGDKISSSKFNKNVRLTIDKLSITADTGREFFTDAVENIVENVRRLLEEKNVAGTNMILLVGGFSESQMLQHAIKTQFPDRKVIIPKDASLSVVRGAVLFGYNSSVITERICKYTYGTATATVFLEGYHDERKKRFMNGKYRCIDLFDKYVEIGHSVKLGVPQGGKEYLPIFEDQDQVDIRVYACTQPSPMYVTDEGCSELGYIRVEILNRSVPRHRRTVIVYLIVSGTELQVKATEMETGKETASSLDFLG